MLATQHTSERSEVFNQNQKNSSGKEELIFPRNLQFTSKGTIKVSGESHAITLREV